MFSKFYFSLAVLLCAAAPAAAQKFFNDDPIAVDHDDEVNVGEPRRLKLNDYYDFLENTFQSKNFQKMYTPQQIERAKQLSECPENDRLCTEAVWLFQSLLLGSRKDMDDIANAIEKIYENRDQLT